ncbi:TonB-dependent hemoglobin/transferrin/lactoferrin family receptor [Tropicimonas sp. IMCC34011]|uniref:TonB-dependent hemoglobin/transferrin/lactoferrin family receptor n=1 Tax=Tropicimonas sp. IMCC34011 TaxID=2248759 RepID=UPI0013006929|nr:TonB-dependent hemoglobin/transferrin/lactoferrin family receptor [Tropicimonas sp. IMCC34011]
MRHRPTPVLCAALCLPTLCPSLAVAQETSFTLDPIIVTTDRSGTAILDVPASITVIGQEEIEDRQVSDIEELVRRVPGVTVNRQSSGADPFSTLGGFTIRGVGGNRVAVQVDGSRMAERIIDGTRDYVDLNFTKQAEIVRGPASVLWGADALGGLVAFETIDPEDLLQGKDEAVRVGAGYDTYDDSVSASLTFGRRLSDSVSVLAGIAQSAAHEPELTNARDDGGIYGCPRATEFGATPCGAFDPTDATSTRALGKLVWTPDAAHRLEFSADALIRDTSVEQDSSLGPVLSTITGAPTGDVIVGKDRALDLYRYRLGLEHTWTPAAGPFDEIVSTLAYTPHGYERRGRELSTSAGGAEILTEDELTYEEDFVELDIQATSRFETGAADHRLIFGFDGDRKRTDYERRDVETNLATGAVTETVAGGFNFANATTQRADVYVEDRITFGGGRFELTPGLRYATYKIDPRPDGDYEEVPGQAPRVRKDETLLKSLGAIVRFDDSWSAWAKYGEGFKMPTAQQLFTSSPGDFFNLTPAPDLKPEEVQSYELGLRYEEPRGFASLSVFKADYSDFIQSFYNPPGTIDYTYRNLSVVNVHGVEAEAGWAFGQGTTMSVSAAWQEGTQQVSDDAEETRHTLPPLTATLALAHEFPDYGLFIEGVATFASDVEETASPDDFKPDAYQVLDLHAKWEMVEDGFLKLSVNNVFDRRYFVANAATYGSTASASVAATNPIELQTGPGRSFAVSFDKTF